MPGIVGIASLNRGKKVPKEVLAKMQDRLCHRPWYRIEKGHNSSETVAFSCIYTGIPHGEEPVVQKHPSGLIVCIEGDLYENGAPASNRTELVVAAYHKYGPQFAEHLDGSFVILILNEKTNEMIMANDRLGSRPVFWRESDGFVYFAPELKAFLPLERSVRQINEEAVIGFLCGGRMVGNKTWFKDVKHLSHGSILRVFEGEIKEEYYWKHRITPIKGPDRGWAYYVDQFSDLLLEAVKKRTKGRSGVGVLLSGGIDSRLIFGAYLKSRPIEPVKTITWGVERDIVNSDGAIAKKLSGANKAQNNYLTIHASALKDHFHEVVYLCDGSHDEPGNYCESLDIFRKIRENHGCSFLLRGDEALAGSLRSVVTESDLLGRVDYRSIDDIPIYMKVLNKERMATLLNLSRIMGSELLSRHSYKSVADRGDSIYFAERLVARFSCLSYLKQMEVEMLNPLIDQDILDFQMQLPQQYRRERAIFQQTLKRTFPEMASFPFATVENLPVWSILLRTDERLKKFIRELLIEEENGFDSYLDKSELERYLTEYFSCPVSTPQTGSSMLVNIKEGLKKMPFLVSAVRAVRKSWVIPDEQIIFRLAVAKSFFKQFDID